MHGSLHLMSVQRQFKGSRCVSTYHHRRGIVLTSMLGKPNRCREQTLQARAVRTKSTHPISCPPDCVIDSGKPCMTRRPGSLRSSPRSTTSRTVSRTSDRSSSPLSASQTSRRPFSVVLMARSKSSPSLSVLHSPPVSRMHARTSALSGSSPTSWVSSSSTSCRGRTRLACYSGNGSQVCVFFPRMRCIQGVHTDEQLFRCWYYRFRARLVMAL